jgi:hypothetical protein
VDFNFPKIKPRKVILVVDASYFGKRREATELDGIMVFIDSITGEVLWAKFIKSETNNHYLKGLDYLESKSFEILGVVSDGRRGLARIFSKYPYQICQFHIQKGVSTLLTRSPKSQAGKDLKQFNDTYIKLKLTKAQFLEQIENYLKIHHDYLNEMSELDPKQPKHKKLRKALNKYKNNVRYMFTYQTNSELQIPNTTNKIDGGVFSPLKRVVNNHPGTTKPRRKNLIIEFLNSRGKTSKSITPKKFL